MYITEINWGLIVFCLFVTGFLIQLWYYWGLFSQLAFYKKQVPEVQTPPVSVIICARNEDDNLTAFLPLILNQDYPNFEVVVVNDCSYDNTADLLDEFARKYNHLKIVTIKEDDYYSHGKKVAVMMGIKGAQHEHLLFTDADCKPNGTNWIANMVNELKGETEIVMGYGGYEKQDGFLNKLIRFDSFIIAVQYLSFCLAGKTYMGVGRNLAYKKSLFFKMKGFASHYHIESGDDDLFVNEAATKKNSKVEIAIESHTISKIKRTFKEWLLQKRRHVSTAKHYNSPTKFRLGMITFSQWLFWLGFITVLVTQFLLYIVLGLFILRLISQFFILKKCMDKLQENDLLWLAPVLELALLFFYPLLVVSKIFLKNNKWKTL
jgi:poly-beta-1,6-N-acetyl-D-glucosamine synthase